MEESLSSPSGIGRTQREAIFVTGASGDAFRATVFTQINVTESPELRAVVLEARAAEVKDPTSGARYTLALPLVYHDEQLKIFALILPDSLRHAEFAQRSALLERLNQADALPRYIREFVTLFGASDLVALEKSLNLGKEDLQKQQQQLEEKARYLSIERQGLQAMRLNLENLKNNLREQETRLQSSSKPKSLKTDNAPTTVVPREVFYKELDIATSEETPWGSSTQQGWELESEDPPTMDGEDPGPRSGSSEDGPQTPELFDRDKAGSRSYYHEVYNGSVQLSYRLGEERMERFTKGNPALFLQLHDLDEFPLITVMLAAIDDEGNLLDDLYWPIDIRQPEDRLLLESLADDFTLQAAFYAEDMKLSSVRSYGEPLELNAQHLLALCADQLSSRKGLSFEDALRRIEAPDYERLGSMRHNFRQDSFLDLDGPSKVKLAAGIVGYWSGPETFRYLIENRSFSLKWFATIQERVVRGAAKYGIALTSELRAMAIEELGLAQDDKQLVKSLTSTWAEVELGVRFKNDLDPLETWENWQELIDAQDSSEDSLDNNVAELARASLRRAQEYAEDNDLLNSFPEDLETVERSHAATEGQKGKSLEGVDEQELKELLNDDEGRLEASLELLKKGGMETLEDVLVATDLMDDDELERLSEQLAESAPRLETALINCLELPNPTIAYLCSFALASIPSSKALPSLFLAIQDGERTPDPVLFAETLFPYGEDLIDALIPALKDVETLGEDHPLAILAVEFGRTSEAALERLEKEIPELTSAL